MQYVEGKQVISDWLSDCQLLRIMSGRLTDAYENIKNLYFFLLILYGEMAKLVDAADLKPAGHLRPCGFDSPFRYDII